jgi:hypothetical protein
LCGTSAFLYGVVEPKDERVEVDWSRQRIRFYGEAISKPDQPFKEAEQAAWQDGLSYLSESIPKLQGAAWTLNRADHSAIVSQISRGLYSYDTQYFSDGRVRVYLESRLSNAFPEATNETVPDNKELGATHSAIVLKVDSRFDPLPIISVVSETGEVLYSIRDVSREAFAAGLMGRWFKADQGADYRNFIGQNPVVLNSQARAPGVFVVPEAEWSQVAQSNPLLLNQARIAIVASHP